MKTNPHLAQNLPNPPTQILNGVLQHCLVVWHPIRDFKSDFKSGCGRQSSLLILGLTHILSKVVAKVNRFVPDNLSA